MWISKLGNFSAQNYDSVAEVGRVTVDTEPLGVMLSYETRNVALAAPGGYIWRPVEGQGVLVIKCGENDLLAVASTDPRETSLPLAAGEICLQSDGGAELYLRGDGRVQIVGDLDVSGSVTSAAPEPEPGSGDTSGGGTPEGGEGDEEGGGDDGTETD